VKVLGQGEITVKLSVSAHAFSKTAAEKIEAAGGSVTWLKPPHEPKKRKHKKAAPAAASAASEATEAEEPVSEPAAAEEPEATEAE